MILFILDLSYISSYTLLMIIKAIDKASDAMMEWIVDHPVSGILGIITTTRL